MKNLKNSIQYLKGIGPKRAKLFKKLGIETTLDLIYYFPREYEDQSRHLLLKDAVDEEKNSFIVKVVEKLPLRYLRNKMTMSTFIVEDSSFSAKMVFFNQKYVENQIKVGEVYFVYGKASWFGKTLSISSSEFSLWSKKKNENLIIPHYGLTQGLTNKDMRKAINQVLKEDFYMPEILPQYIIDKYKFIDKTSAFKLMHNPATNEDIRVARRRLVFEELFLFQLHILTMKAENKSESSIVFKDRPEVYSLIENLPFKLTDSQHVVLEQVLKDMKSPEKMVRLIQGDVGSGKTIIAIIAMYFAVINGYQATIMVPTEVLAKQHLKAIREILDVFNIHTELLVGSLTPKNKTIILERLKNGEIDILVGTHALIEENVEFFNLGLTITDEQHRFGVNQRKIFTNKNRSSDSLVMTATPIPRTLAMILYGDLDISVIDTLPPGRIPIETVAINEKMLDRALNFVKSEVDSGRQAYIICPLVEDSENLNLNSVQSIYEDLKNNYFTRVNIEFLHGKMSSEEKTKIMTDFERGNIHVLVSTTVIEVGINVPNASVILIYNAERFGLAQLHQLRGRVGRGKNKSYCILYNDSNTKLSWQRMKVIEGSTDGFLISEEDLNLRGEGDILGTRQHGLPEFRLAMLSKDMTILKYAQMEANHLLKLDPHLNADEHRGLKILIDEKMEEFK